MITKIRGHIKQHPYTAILFIIIVVSWIIVFCACVKKTGVNFVDEQWVVAAASSKERAFVSDTPNAWLTSKEFKNYITVQNDERFDFSIPYHRCIDLYFQPPLYFILLHTLLSFAIDYFSKWFGLSINLTLFPFTILLIYLSGKSFFQSQKWALVSSALYAFSLGTLSTFVYHHVYALSAFSISLSLYFIATCWQNPSKRRLIGLFISFTIGGLSNYLFWLFAGIEVAIFIVFNINHLKNMLKVSLTSLLSFFFTSMLWPTTILQFIDSNYSSWNAEKSKEGLLGIFHFSLQKFIYIYNSIITYYFSIKVRPLIIVIFTVLFLISLILAKYYKRRSTPLHLGQFVVLLLSCYLIANISSFMGLPGSRYFMMLYPLVAIIITRSIKSIYDLIQHYTIKIRLSFYFIIFIIYFVINGTFPQLNESWFVNTSASNMSEYNYYINDAHIFYVTNEDHAVTNLSYSFDLIKEVFLVSPSKDQSNFIDIGSIIAEQIKNHIPFGEKIIISKQLPVNFDFAKNELFLSALRKNGYGVISRAAGIGNGRLNDVYEVVPLTSDELKIASVLQRTTSMMDYFDLLIENKDELLILCSVGQDAGTHMTNELQLKLVELGLKSSFIKNADNSSYIAVIDNGTVLYEELGREENIEIRHVFTNQQNEKFELYSRGWRPEQSGSTNVGILVNGADYSQQHRGFNIVVYDNHNHKLIDSISFDTWFAGHEAYRKNNI